MRLHPYGYIEITRWPSKVSCIALSLDPQPHAGVHAGRDIDLEALLLFLLTPALAGLARGGDDLSRAGAGLPDALRRSGPAVLVRELTQ